MTVRGEPRLLPVGSTLDTEKGLFYWLPGPGFKGTYEFIFLKERNVGDDHIKEKIKVHIRFN